MAKQLFTDKGAKKARKGWENYYSQKYLNIWLNRFKINGLTKPQRLWLLKKLWFESGPICAFKAIDLDKSYLSALPEKQQLELGGNVGLGLASFGESNYNMYSYASTGYIINEMGVPYVPKGLKKVGSDIVIMYPTYSGKGLYSFAEPIIKALVDCEMEMRKGAKLATSGAGIEVSPNCPQRADELARKVMSDEIVSFIESDETKTLSPFNLAFQWNVDKVRIEKEAREAELRCLLGLESVATEKKERLIKDEANSLSEMCEISKDCFLNPLKDFVSEIKEVLGFDISIEDPYERKESEDDGRPEDSDENVQ